MCFGKDHPYKSLRTSIKHKNQEHFYYDVSQLNPQLFSQLPFCLRMLLESTVRHCNNISIENKHVQQILNWQENTISNSELPFLPSQVIMHDFSGLPAIIDLAAMRDAAVRLGADPHVIQPKIPTTLLLDYYNIEADVARKIVRKTTDTNNTTNLECGYELCPFHQEKTVCADAIERNQQLEFERNIEKLQIMKWSASAFNQLSIVPPGISVCQQINLEYLSKLILFDKDNDEQLTFIHPDTIIGTDTHTTLSNGFGVLSYNMGTIEAEAAMFGQPIQIRLSSVIIGCRLIGQPHFMSTSIDLISALMKYLRQIGLNNKYIEFFGSSLNYLTIADRSSIAHLCVEQGALLAYFPMDDSCLKHFSRTGRDKTFLDQLRDYLTTAKLFNDDIEHQNIVYTNVYEFDLCTVMPNCSGPKRAQDKVSLYSMKSDFSECLTAPMGFKGYNLPTDQLDCSASVSPDEILKHGSITLAAITSSTNGISHATPLLTTGLLAKKALEYGLRVPSFTQAYLSPGSGVITTYLRESGTLQFLEKLGFHITGYGCKECIQNEENNGLKSDIKQIVNENNLITVGMVSNIRQTQQKHSIIKANYVTSPPLVLAYALAGNVLFDLEQETFGLRNAKISIRDIWPNRQEIEEIEDEIIIKKILNQFNERVQIGNPQWDSLKIPSADRYPQYPWAEYSSYISRAPFFDTITQKNTLSKIICINNARVLLYLGDNVSTDHISPAGSISRTCPAAKYLTQKGIPPRDYNSFGSRRGNDSVMVRGTFNHVRLNNKLVAKRIPSLLPSSSPSPATTTLYLPSNLEMDIFDASEHYRNTRTPLIVLAGKDYGCGPSRDWVAKGPWMLGVRAVLAESFEPQHRSNLIGMSILPLEFQNGDTCASLNLTGKELYSIEYNIYDADKSAIVKLDNGKTFSMIARVDTEIERLYMLHGGFLPYVLRQTVN
jgi:aconitate hydratase